MESVFIIQGRYKLALSNLSNLAWQSQLLHLLRLLVSTSFLSSLLCSLYKGARNHVPRTFFILFKTGCLTHRNRRFR